MHDRSVIDRLIAAIPRGALAAYDPASYSSAPSGGPLASEKPSI